MEPFLRSIARGYSQQYASFLSDICFVFPNKRAGTFFLKELKGFSKNMTFAPKVTTITDLVADLSGRVVNTRIDTLFLLHKCYCEIVSPHLTEEGREEYLSFDAFRRWGETVLSDFNEVDIHLAPADAIFKNLFDFRSIASTFLTEEQRALMEEYFGYKASKQYDDNKFWLEFGEKYAEFDDSDTDDSPRSRFIHLWKVLSPLYDRFHNALAKKGLTTSGGSYRLAVEKLREAIEEGEESVRALLPYPKIVMIGFNALSMSERALFEMLQRLDSPVADEPLADFVWDSTGPILEDKNNSAGRFVTINRRNFPSPDWLKSYIAKSEIDTRLPYKNRLPEITAMAAPSKVMQVKIAAELINNKQKEIGNKPFENAEVAMVLPDESLLLPLLYSLPKDLSDANLTMGYPLKLTAVTSFLMLLRRMQLMRRDSSKHKGYAFEEVKDLLGHPYAHAIIGSSRISSFVTYFQKRHISVVTDSDLRFLGDAGKILLNPLPTDAEPKVVIKYIDNVLDLVEKALSPNKSSKNKLLNGRIELANVSAWREALARLDDSIEEYNVKLSAAGTLAEVFRLLQGETVAFEGEPLKGFQIMGMLETRSLDFKHLVIVSVNDKILPRRSRQRSFLPNVLRRGYGLPPVNYAESMFAYYFYRAMSRAETVTLIYDNRISGVTGGPSRYLMQLDHMYAKGLVKHQEYKFTLKSHKPSATIVKKTDEIMDILDSYCRPPKQGERRKNLSASALKKYINCHLKFYLQAVEGFRDDPAPSKTIDAITYGNIIHSIMEELLIEDPALRKKWLDTPIRITKEKIEKLLDDSGRIYKFIHHHINKEFYFLEDNEIERPLPPDAADIADIAVTQVLNILRHDLTLAPFNLYGCEVSQNLEYDLGKRKINMTYAIDRIDDAECTEPGQIRIVDYKTGSTSITAPSIEAVFDGSANSDHYFQLQLYAELLNLHRKKEGKSPLSIKPVIYAVTSLDKKEKKYPKIGDSRIEWHDQEDVSNEFINHLNNMLEDIFDPSLPFDGLYQADHCQYCAFKSLCKD